MDETPPKTLLQVRDLAVTFPGAGNHAEPVVALDGVSFDIDSGQSVALVGESGSGKSTVAVSILGLLEFSGPHDLQGSIRLSSDGGKQRELTRLPASEMSRIRGNDIAIVFQNPTSALNPVMTVGRQIAEVYEIHQKLRLRTARLAALDVLARVRMPDVKTVYGRYPHELSGGMQQRAMIAMAIACRPRLLIADEPTTALDVTLQAQILDLLAGLREELGMSLLLITHDVGVVAQTAEVVHVMTAGRIVESGPVHTVLTAPKHVYTKSLLACLP